MDGCPGLLLSRVRSTLHLVRSVTKLWRHSSFVVANTPSRATTRFGSCTMLGLCRLSWTVVVIIPSVAD